jgi:DNA-binding NarL/FixJ family response regulator
MNSSSASTEIISLNRPTTPTKSTLAGESASTPVNVIQSDACIHIISDSHLLREALNLFLNQWQPDDLISHYTGADSAPSTLKDSSVQLLLLDSGIGRELAIGLIQQWRSLFSSIHIVVLEVKKDTDLILSFIEAGAHAYAFQGASSHEIKKIIEQVYQGSFQCSPEITATLFARLSQPQMIQQSREKTPLTRRELEVLYYVSKGYSDREISTQLVIEIRTVKHHVHNSLQKLNVRYRRDAAEVALENGWLAAF